MRQLLLIFSAACLFAACSGDNISISPDQLGIDEDQAYLSVYVAVEDLEANSGGCAEGTYVHALEGAEISVFYLDEERPISPDAILTGFTNKKGVLVFEELPKGNFKVVVNSKYGTEQRAIATVLGKMTKVFIRF